jgi:hypothetical protein
LFQAESRGKVCGDVVPDSTQRQIQNTAAPVDALVVDDGRGLSQLARAIVDNVRLVGEQLRQVLLERGAGEQGAVLHLQGLVGVERNLQARDDLIDLVIWRQQLLSNEAVGFQTVQKKLQVQCGIYLFVVLFFFYEAPLVQERGQPTTPCEHGGADDLLVFSQ